MRSLKPAAKPVSPKNHNGAASAIFGKMIPHLTARIKTEADIAPMIRRVKVSRKCNVLVERPVMTSFP